MGESACAYYLRGDRIDDAFEFLDRWGSPGYVHPPHNGWIPFVAEKTYIFDAAEGAYNRGLLLRFVPDTAFGWQFVVWEGTHLAATYFRYWLAPNLEYSPPELVGRLAAWFPQLDGHQAELTALLRLDGRTCDLNGVETVRRFAELLGLLYFDGLGHRLFDQHPRDALDADAWLAYDPRIGVPISAVAPRVNRLTGLDVCAPAILYATRDVAHREWLKLTRKVWKGARWADVLADLQIVPLGELGDEICVSCLPNRSMFYNRKMWRLHVVGDCITELFHHYKNKHKHPVREVRERLNAVLAMPDVPLWFDLGIAYNAVNLIVAGDDRRSVRRRQARDFLQRLLERVPLINNLEQSIRHVFNGERDDLWPFVIVALAQQCGYDLRKVQDELFHKSYSETLERLIAAGVFCREGARVVLSPGPD